MGRVDALNFHSYGFGVARTSLVLAAGVPSLYIIHDHARHAEKENPAVAGFLHFFVLGMYKDVGTYLLDELRVEGSAFWWYAFGGVG